MLVADLYRLSNENKTFLHTRFEVGDDPLGPYKQTIEKCMYPDVYGNSPIQVSKAKRAISSYSKALGDPIGEAELMTFFVECDNNFTLDFGDIDEAFYGPDGHFKIPHLWPGQNPPGAAEDMLLILSPKIQPYSSFFIRKISVYFRSSGQQPL